LPFYSNLLPPFGELKLQVRGRCFGCNIALNNLQDARTAKSPKARTQSRPARILETKRDRTCYSRSNHLTLGDFVISFYSQSSI